MSIEWTDEAVKEALHELDGWSSNNFEAMRAALDAAVKAQGFMLTPEMYASHMDESYADGRTEAFEEAAKMCDGNSLWTNDECAAAIRALAKEPPK